MPKAELEALRAIADGVWTARRGAQRMVAFRLADGELAFYSPVAGLTEAFRTSVDALGTVAAIVAPNHFHHLGVTEHADAFDVDTLVAPEGAIPRLERQTGHSFASLATIEDRLAKGTALTVTEGARADEAWFRFAHEGGTGYGVCDAFGAKAAPDDPPLEEPVIRGSFPMMCLPKKSEQRAPYIAWARERIAADRPTLLLPCHGAMVVSPDLPAMLDRLLESL